MAISHLARRLLSPTSTAAKLFPEMSFPKPHAHARNPLLLLHPHRRFSTTPDSSSKPEAASATANADTAASLRRVIKPVAFFQKMEANGRLQVLTLCLQATKNVNLMLLRTRVVAISCALGVSVGSVAAILMR